MKTVSKNCPKCDTKVEVTLMTTSEAGKISRGVTYATILHHIKDTKILPAIKPGKEWLIQPEDLQLIANRKSGNPHTKKG